MEAGFDIDAWGCACRDLQGKLVVPVMAYLERYNYALAKKKMEEAANAHIGERFDSRTCINLQCV